MSKADKTSRACCNSFLRSSDAKPKIKQRFAAQKDVLRDAHLGHEIEFLVDGADPQLLRIVGTADVDRLAIEKNLARIGG